MAWGNRGNSDLGTIFLDFQCAVAFYLHVLKSCTDLDLTLLYILILGTYGNFFVLNPMLL